MLIPLQMLCIADSSSSDSRSQMALEHFGCYTAIFDEDKDSSFVPSGDPQILHIKRVLRRRALQ